jgi:hypothetical protein
MEGFAAPAAANLSPVARDYPSRALGGFFMPPRCDCSIKERDEAGQWSPIWKAKVLNNFFAALMVHKL